MRDSTRWAVLIKGIVNKAEVVSVLIKGIVKPKNDISPVFDFLILFVCIDGCG